MQLNLVRQSVLSADNTINDAVDAVEDRIGCKVGNQESQEGTVWATITDRLQHSS